MENLARRLVVLAAALTMVACAAGDGPGTVDAGGGMDAGVSDSGPPPVDAGPEDAGPEDSGPADSGINLTDGTTCDPCAEDDNCGPGLFCAGLGSGGRACLPACNIDLPDCPPRFDCVMNFQEESFDEPICAPVGERCCVDEDGDLHGEGVGCLGNDCDETDDATNSSATEACDGSDNDCDGTIDEGSSDLLCPRGLHVAMSECSELGVCENTECEVGWGDCDGDPTNGCEQATDTLMHCGGCFTDCSLPNATSDCSSGTCQIDTCDEGWGDCNAMAADGCETPLNTITHCGSCGAACAPFGAIGDCSSGTCQIGSCNPGRGDCDDSPINGCETSTTTNANCGGCGTLCAPARAVGDCSTGTCRITACTRSDYDDCDDIAINGCETSLRTNTDCNGCGVPCTFPGGSGTCVSGVCTLTGCASGLGDCDGSPGCEQMLNTLTHCGDCGVPCAPPNAAGSCSTGTCEITSCSPGYADCDGLVGNGCETELDTLSNCGGCGNVCDPANADGTCATESCRIDECDVGWGQCNTSHADGCETNLRSNGNCGGCGVPCSRSNSTTSCATGNCTWTGCQTGYSTCDGSTSNGCELSHNATAGACGGGQNAGSYDGDRNCGFVCGGNTSWNNFATFTARTDAWYKGRVVEDSDCSTTIEHRIRLSVPAGIDYDLFVYRGATCGTLAGSSQTRGNGEDEVVTISEGDSFASSDSFDYYVHVVYVGGSSCSNYTIRFDGHDC